jgi:FHA domain
MSKAILTFALTQAGMQSRVRVAQDIVKLGKDSKSHIRIEDEAAARMHAVIEVGGPEDITLIDLGNEPGTFVNGARINKCKLHVGDAIQIADTCMVLESAEPPATFRAAAPAADTLLKFRTPSPFAVAASEPVWGSDSDGLTPTSYALIKSGPPVDPTEVELANVQSAEVMVMWGANVLHVTHLTPPRDFYVGEEQSDHLGCDFFVPSEKLGTTRMPLLLVEQGTTYVVIPAGAEGSIELSGQGTLSLADARTRGEPCTALSGAHKFALPPKAKAKVELGGFVFHVGNVTAGKPVKHGVAAGVDKNAFAYFGLSAMVHASLIAGLAFFMPGMGFTDDEDLDRSRADMMMQYLRASAERNQEQREEDSQNENTKNNEGGTGARAKHEEGAMGNQTSRQHNKRFANAGPKENTDVHLARDRALREAQNYGIIGLLNAGLAGDPKAPTALFGRETSLGNDEMSAMGNMFGAEIGEAFGQGGLGLTGIGEGGGGRGEGVGLGDIGIGHGCCLGGGQGFGMGHGRLTGAHATKVPRVGMIGQTTVSGRLPPEVIQRIVRQNFGRFRMCYTQGLTNNPNLEGRVAARFVIGRDGAVSNVSNGGSDIPDSGVVQCVLSAFYGLSFPQPEGGIVTVVYPIMLSPG